MQTNSNDLEILAKAIGLIVLQWGQAEQGLDLLVAMLWQDFNGKRHAKKIPKMLEPKISFIRKCFSSELILKKESEITSQLLNRFEEMSNLRHDLIHSAVTSISHIENSFVFYKLDIKDGFHYHREVRLEAEEYPVIIDKLVALGRNVNEVNEKIYALVN